MLLSEKNHVLVTFTTLLLLFVIGSHAKPLFSFNLQSFADFRQNGKDNRTKLKHYTGKRAFQDSLRMVYVNDMTVAVVELGPNKLLLNCELIEIFTPDQVNEVLGDFKTRIMPISFDEMLTLMHQCMQLQEIQFKKHYTEVRQNNPDLLEQARGIRNPFSLLSGIIPGTKWCGTGDIASNYFDLGTEPTVDVCCRAHDLCPTKIKALSTKNNLTNNSLYTKSHCRCDDDFYQCLRRAGTASANIMGNIYFNIVQVPCVENTEDGLQFRTARNKF